MVILDQKRELEEDGRSIMRLWKARELATAI
jgi:hypothetical protein